MEYLHDVFLANLNVVERLGDFFSLEKGGRWENGYHTFEQNKFYCVTGGEFSISVADKTYHAKQQLRYHLFHYY